MKIIQKFLTSLIAVFILLVPATPVFAASLTPPAPTTGEYTCTRNQSQTSCLAENPIVKWLNFFINLLAAIVFVGATAMMIFAGIEYTAAGDNTQKVQAAKQRITNVIIGLIAFFFLYAFMNWLIPGGVI